MSLDEKSPDSVFDRRSTDRRSGLDTRSEADRRQYGERRSGIDRRTEAAMTPPSAEQLALFARRLKRAVRDEKSRAFFGVMHGEADFSLYPDVVRVLDWLERLSAEESEAQPAETTRPSLRRRAF